MFMHGAQVEDTIMLVFYHPPNFPKGTLFVLFIYLSGGFPGASDGKEFACNAGDLGWRREWYLLQYSCRGNPLDRGT